MKATVRFVISSVSASEIGIDFRELYVVELNDYQFEGAEGGQYVTCKIVNTNKFAPFLLEIAEISFCAHSLVIRAWFVYNFEKEKESRLFRGSLEIRGIH